MRVPGRILSDPAKRGSSGVNWNVSGRWGLAFQASECWASWEICTLSRTMLSARICGLVTLLRSKGETAMREWRSWKSPVLRWDGRRKGWTTYLNRRWGMSFVTSCLLFLFSFQWSNRPSLRFNVKWFLRSDSHRHRLMVIHADALGPQPFSPGWSLFWTLSSDTYLPSEHGHWRIDIMDTSNLTRPKLNSWPKHYLFSCVLWWLWSWNKQQLWMSIDP